MHKTGRLTIALPSGEAILDVSLCALQSRFAAGIMPPADLTFGREPAERFAGVDVTLTPAECRCDEDD